MYLINEKQKEDLLKLLGNSLTYNQAAWAINMLLNLPKEVKDSRLKK